MAYLKRLPHPHPTFILLHYPQRTQRLDQPSDLLTVGALEVGGDAFDAEGDFGLGDDAAQSGQALGFGGEGRPLGQVGSRGDYWSRTGRLD